MFCGHGFGIKTDWVNRRNLDFNKSSKIQDEIRDTNDEILNTPLTEKSKKGDSLSIIIQEAEDSINEKDFVKAKALFQAMAQLSSLNQGQKDLYLEHCLAFATYKTALPDLVTSLYESLKLLQSINLAHTNDPETFSSAGAIEKKIFEKEKVISTQGTQFYISSVAITC